MYNYQELLNAEEWKKFKGEILKRDNYTCQICHKKGFQNHLFVPITSLTEALDFFQIIDLMEKQYKKLLLIKKIVSVKNISLSLPNGIIIIAR